VKPRRVLVFGAFDRLHPGHLDFLRQAKAKGDNLTVVVGREKTVFFRKQRWPQQSERIRLQKVQKVPFVDQVVLGYSSEQIEEQLRIVKELAPEIICLGYDQRPDAAELKELLEKQGIEGISIETLKPYHPEKFKSSKL
jgi:FAD synthetase